MKKIAAGWQSADGGLDLIAEKARLAAIQTDNMQEVMRQAMLLKYSYPGDTCVSMKVAVSIPDQVFKNADELAHKLKKPRSRLYTEALASYIESHDPGAITENLNQIYGRVPSAVDPALEKAQFETLSDETW